MSKYRRSQSLVVSEMSIPAYHLSSKCDNLHHDQYDALFLFLNIFQQQDLFSQCV